MLWLCARLTPLSPSEIKLSGVTDVLDDLIRFPLPADVRGEHNEMSGGIKSAITIPLHLPHLNTNLDMSFHEGKYELKMKIYLGPSGGWVRRLEILCRSDRTINILLTRQK